MGKPVRDRVVTYITQGERLLIFRHTQYPEAGIQVPGGTVEPGESLAAAALREAAEESGLAQRDCELVRYLGLRELDLTPLGRAEIVRLHFYHLRFSGSSPDVWLHYELDPSDGTHGPIEFELRWVRMPDEVPPMTGSQDALLPEIFQTGAA